MKLKPEYRLRDSDQVPTQPVGLHSIMSTPTFQLGVADARAGRGYHGDYDLWDTNGQWNYERGRMWALLAPRNVPLKLKGEINPKVFEFMGNEII